MTAITSGYSASQNFDTIQYGGFVLDAYQEGDLMGEDKMLFFGKKATELVNVPRMESDYALNYADGQDHMTLDQNEMSGVDVPLFEPVKSFKPIPYSQLDVRPDLSMRERFGRQHGRNVATGKTIRTINFIAKAASTANHEVSLAGSLTGAARGEALRLEVNNIGIEFSALGMPVDDGWYGIIKPDLFWQIPTTLLFAAAEYDDGQNQNVKTWRANQWWMYQGFKIAMFSAAFGQNWTASAFAGLDLPEASEFDMTDVLGVFWHKEAWALRHQTGLGIAYHDIPQQQSWLTGARQQLGYKEVRGGDGLFVLLDSGS